MDPDKTLETLRNLCNNWESLPPKHVEDTFVKEVAAMDNWLKEGGRLPKDWSSNKNGT